MKELTSDQIFEGFKRCVRYVDCDGCPIRDDEWIEKGYVACRNFATRTIDIPYWLAEQIIKQLEECFNSRKKFNQLLLHNVGNVDIPDWMTAKQFYSFMEKIGEAVEHTERGESWPYDQQAGGDAEEATPSAEVDLND